MSAKLPNGPDNLCEVLTDHASRIDENVKSVSIPSNGTLTLTKNDNTTTDVSIPYFEDRVVSGLDVTQQASPNQLDFDYSAGIYQLDGVLYNVSAGGTLSLSAGDPLLDRIDVIYGDNAGNVQVAEGTPSNPAVVPVFSGLELQKVFVGAGANNTSGSTGPFNPGTNFINLSPAATVQLDFSSEANAFRLEMTQDTTIQFSNLMTGSTDYKEITLFLEQDSVGGHIVTFPTTGITWADGFEPIFTTTADEYDILKFVNVGLNTKVAGVMVGGSFTKS